MTSCKHKLLVSRSVADMDVTEFGCPSCKMVKTVINRDVRKMSEPCLLAFVRSEFDKDAHDQVLT